MPLTELASICEDAIPVLDANGKLDGSFQMPGVSLAVLQLEDVHDLFPDLATLEPLVQAADFIKLLRCALRAGLFIEPVVLPAVNTTRYQVRWRMPADDPRFASAEECLAISRQVMTEIIDLLSTEDGLTIVKSFLAHPQVPYELPIGYKDREQPIHRTDNFTQCDHELVRHVTGCRLLLLAPATPHRQTFVEAYTKISTKTYLTDRVLTGLHKTNREKRWEAHPNSVHFAHRSTCLEIERVLVNQMCHFEGFPDNVRALLEEQELLLPLESPTRCPVTNLPMSFDLFEAGLLNPVMGKSAFQVGHLDPLKLEGNEWAEGHRHDNIAWISADGNRIQGSLSIDQTRALLGQIWDAYTTLGLIG